MTSNSKNYSPEINLSNLKDHTEQQVFDFVVSHLRKQGEQSNGENGCAYRGYNAHGDILMCAAGCLISDDQYKEEMDAEMDDTSWDYFVAQELVPSSHRMLIQKLQCVHDCWKEDLWESKFQDVALQFNLTLEPKP